MMNTFSSILEISAKDILESKIIPDLERSAKDLAKEGMDKLELFARTYGKVLPVRLTYEGGNFRHRAKLTLEIRKLLPIDVRVTSTMVRENTISFTLSTCEVYALKSGKKDYDFPTYGLRICNRNDYRFYTNYKHLVAIGAHTEEVSAFKAVLEFFKSTKRVNSFRGSSVCNITEFSITEFNIIKILNWTLEWALANPISGLRLFHGEVAPYVFRRLPLIYMKSQDSDQLKAKVNKVFSDLGKLTSKKLWAVVRTL